MRYFIVVALLLGGGQASAEVASSLPPTVKSAPSAAAVKVEQEAAIANCVQMWDRGTHMTPRQWLATCRRVQNRLQHLQMK